MAVGRSAQSLPCSTVVPESNKEPTEPHSPCEGLRAVEVLGGVGGGTR